MKKLFTAFVILLLAFPIAGAMGTNYYVNASTGNDSYDGLSATPTGGTNGPKATIQAAITAASNGDIIEVANGTYSSGGSTISVNKSLTLQGASMAGTIIDVSTNGSSWGVQLCADNITFRNFTIIPGSATGNGYPIHASGTASPKVALTGLTIENVTISGSYRTGCDIHGCDNTLLNNITSTGAAYGVGAAVTACHNVTMTNITTSGNAWGGVAIFCSNYFSAPRASDNVNINSANSTLGEANKLYVEDQYSVASTNINASGFEYIVKSVDPGPPQDLTHFAFYQLTQTDAIAFACAATHVPTMYVIQKATGDLVVGHVGSVYMSIQTAVDQAPAGGEVMVGAGTYVEQVEIAKNLTLEGAGSGTIIQSPATLTKYFTTSANNYPVIYIHDAANVQVIQLIVDGAGNGHANSRFIGIGCRNAGGTIDQCVIRDVRCTPFDGDPSVAIYAYADNGTDRALTISNSTISGYQKNGMALNGANLTSTVTGNNVTGGGHLGSIAQNGIQIGYGGKGSISGNTISNNYWTAIYPGSIDNNPTTDPKADGSAGILLYDPGTPTITIDNNLCNGNQFGIWTVGAASVNIHDNTVNGSPADGHAFPTGIAIWTSDQWGATDRGTAGSITANRIPWNEYGIIIRKYVSSSPVPTIVAHDNFVYGNVPYGAWSNVPFNAEANWWGSVAGPYHSTNPSTTGDPVSDNVDFDPWDITGDAYHSTDVNAAYNLDTNNDGTNDASLKFSTLPPSDGYVVMNRYATAPSGYPALPSNALPGFYLVVTSTIPNGTFNVWVTINGLNVAAADTGTYKLAYFNTATSSWVLMNGGFWEHAATATWYTYPTNHFTVFGFVGGALSDYHNTPATAYPVYIAPHPGNAAYLSDAANRIIYPNENWSGGYSGASHDWGWSGSQPVTVYIVPGTTGEFGSSRIDVQWTDGVLGSVTADRTATGYNGLYESGDPYPNQFIANTLGSTNYVRIDASRMDNNNFTPAGAPGTAIAAGDFIAKLNLNLLHPGSTPIDIVGADFRWFVSGNPFKYVYVNSFATTLKAYLGDVANASDETSGDGKIDVSDLAIWSNAYWSGVAGFPGGMTNYKRKFDIGPTADNYVFTLPSPDNKIEFEDLMIFSINYGLSAGNALPKAAPASDAPLFVTLGAAERTGGETRIPVLVSGNVSDLRGLKLRLSGSHGRLIGVEKGELLRSYATPVPVMSLVNGRDIAVDLAVLGLDTPAMAREGEVVVLRFAGDARLAFTAAEARTSANRALKTQIRSEVPVSMTLEQNYPNPFNPSTTIGYSLPERATVELAVYNLLGGKVAVLEQGEREAGMHAAVWNGRNGAGVPVASGLYVYRLTAGGTTIQKAMTLVK